MIELAVLSLAAMPIGPGEDFAIPWARIILSLFFCAALAALAIAFLRRRSGAMPMFATLLSADSKRERELELIERLQLSPASQICLVRCGEERVLLHVSTTGAQLLARINDSSVMSDVEK